MVDIEEVNDDDDDEVDQSDELTGNIQLGFSEPIRPQDAAVIGHRSPRWWKDWDGGQLGGRPSWLQPKDLPRALTCRLCSGTMQFLGQLYAPLDHVPAAFHRSFYLFGCPKCAGIGSANGQGIRVLRVQLTQDNPFYPPENSPHHDWKQHLPGTWGVKLCRVCGQRGTGKCPLQQVWFCGKIHQKEYKRYGNKNKNSQHKEEQEVPALMDESTGDADPERSSTSVDEFLPSVYTESELVVEQEPPVGEDQDDEDEDDEDEVEARPTMFQSATDGDGRDSDEDLEQDDLNEIVTGTKLDQTSTKDPVTKAFYKRIQERKGAAEQCLRYNLEWRRKYDSITSADSFHPATGDEENGDGHGPLWVGSDHQPAEIPPCPYCQAPRAFEFQLMPQTLHFLYSNRPTQTPSASEQTQNNETAKKALIAANSIIANSDPTQIPPSFADAKAKAMQALQRDLFQQDSQRVEWGVVAIYSCTKSCSDGTIDEAMGVYREEFAWLQPALDA